MTQNVDITTISSLISLSIAPVFLLAGIAGLLNLFNARLTRIMDKIDKIDKYEHNADFSKEDKLHQILIQRRHFLVMRMRNTNRAIFFGTATGLLISFVIIAIFLGAFLDFRHPYFIVILFILAMLSLVASLLLFLKELSYTSRFINNKESYIP